jgi:S1-C subfamily serine protease
MKGRIMSQLPPSIGRTRFPSSFKPEPDKKPTPPPKPNRLQKFKTLGRNLLWVVIGVMIAFIALVAYNRAYPGPKVYNANEISEMIALAMASATPPPPMAAVVYDIIRPSMVWIETKVLTTEGKNDGGRGSGVVVDDQGLILTSWHVVEKALNIRVIFYDGTDSEANVVGKDPERDIAVLRAKILPDQLVPATLGNPRALSPGDEVVAVGHPFGIANTVTKGVVSGLNRTFTPPNKDQALKGLIQFDAAVNPGNSGGPLLNANGEVVGIVTGLINPTKQDVFIGIGFAVPIDMAAAAAGSPVQ